MSNYETWGFVAWWTFTFLGWAFGLTSMLIVFKRRDGKSLAPKGSRVVTWLQRFARWTTAIARATDVGLVEYRAVIGKREDTFSDQMELLSRKPS